MHAWVYVASLDRPERVTAVLLSKLSAFQDLRVLIKRAGTYRGERSLFGHN